jgi:hypothetical protein
MYTEQERSMGVSGSQRAVSLIFEEIRDTSLLPGSCS